MMIKPQHYRFSLGAALFFLSFFFGRLSWQWQEHLNIPDVQELLREGDRIPVVFIDDIQDAEIRGRVNDKRVRIQSGEMLAIPEEDLSFTLPIDHLGFVGPKRPVIKLSIPEGAQFVASKSGKYYYPLDDKQAKRLSVKNRVYFESEEEAIRSGYKRR